MYKRQVEKYRTKNPRRSKLFLTASVLFSLLLLGYCKYTDFFISSVNAVTGLSIPLLRIALPIGISFYTFQILSYVVDVSRGTVAAQRNLIDLGAYIAMFPQLIAGPIVRYADIEPQLRERRSTPEMIAAGAQRFVLGLAKKVLIANVLYQLITTYKGSAGPSVLFGWMYAVAYLLHIYFDFSGYSDMAIGLGKIFGFTFAENFNYPYISRSITEFWRRWHISLGVWFRTYLLYPLVASRAGIGLAKVGKRLFGAKAGRAMPGAAASMVVFLLIGVWHGFYWNAVLYGLWFGLLTAAGMLLDPQFRKIRKRVTAHRGGAALMKAFGWLRTMAAVLLAQFFACTTSPGMAFGMMGRIFTDFGAGMTRNFPLGMQDGVVAIIAVLLMLLVDILCEKQPDLRKKLAVSPLYVRWTLLMGLMFLTLIFGCYGAGFDRAAFLYAGF